jgi:hypothetical protein
MDMATLVKAHVAIRDKREELTKEFNQTDKDLKEKQERLEAEMLRFMQESGSDSIRTEAGTIYRQESVKPAASDWAAFYDWVKQHDAFDALEKRIKAKFVKDYMDENDGETPPGVSVHRSYVARVRRA